MYLIRFPQLPAPAEFDDSIKSTWLDCVLRADPKTGQLPQIEELAQEFRRPPEVTRAAIRKLLENQWLRRAPDGRLACPSWVRFVLADRTNAERQRRFRNRKKARVTLRNALRAEFGNFPDESDETELLNGVTLRNALRALSRREPRNALRAGTKEKDGEKETEKEKNRGRKERERERGPEKENLMPTPLTSFEEWVSEKPETCGQTPPKKPVFALEPESKAPAPCPHKEIIALYHQILPMCPRVRVWDEHRRALLKARWSEDKQRQSLDWWRDFFARVARSEFLTGRGFSNRDRPFIADLEWLIRPKNFGKILNGRYDPRPRAAGIDWLTEEGTDEATE